MCAPTRYAPDRLCEQSAGPAAQPESASVDLFWLPLGAGGYIVWFNGRAFEALSALRQRRARCDLYRTALEIRVRDERFTVEMGPSHRGSPRAAVAHGPVGDLDSANEVGGGYAEPPGKLAN